jgi:putative transposase
MNKRDTGSGPNVGEAFRPPAAPLPAWLPTRQRNRLPLAVYRESGAFFLTIATAYRRPWFADAVIAQHCIAELQSSCETHRFGLLAYCFMPDHLHVLVSTEGGSDLVRLIHGFKQKTAWWFKNREAAGGLKASPTSGSPTVPRLWQKSYYDHVLRKDEDIAAIVRYIVENPVRAGLVTSLDEYPHRWNAYGVLEAV